MNWLIPLINAYRKIMARPSPPTPAILAAAPRSAPADFPETQHETTLAYTSDGETAIARTLGITVAQLKAVAEVESGGKYRWNGGRIPLLFERHVFMRTLIAVKGKDFAEAFAASYPDLCNHTPGGYGGSSAQYPKIARLIKMGFAEEAYRSASWGAFQIMGNNFAACGFTSATQMVNALHQEPVEANALKAFANFVGSHPPMVAALKYGDYATFARLYNGSNYRINSYDTKIAAAVKKYS